MNKIQLLQEYEIIFFTDDEENECCGLLLEGDFFEAQSLTEIICYRFEQGNMVFFTQTKELVLSNISKQLVGLIEEKGVCSILLVDMDAMLECHPV